MVVKVMFVSQLVMFLCIDKGDHLYFLFLKCISIESEFQVINFSFYLCLAKDSKSILGVLDSEISLL